MLFGLFLASCQGEVDKRTDAEIHRDKYGSIFGSSKIEDAVLDEPLGINNKDKKSYFGADVNYYVWKASLEFANRHGLEEMDTASGFISTFWRKSKAKDKDIKINFFVKSPELTISALEVKTYVRVVENKKYVITEADEDINISIRNNILDRANKLYKAENN